MEYIIFILKSHIVLSIILGFVYLIEIRLNLFIFIRWFYYPKDTRSAKASADSETILYVVYHIIYFFIEGAKYSISFWYLLVIILILAIIFHRLYNKYQKIDTTKEDFLGKLKKKK